MTAAVFVFQGERESVEHDSLELDRDVAERIGKVLCIEQHFPDGSIRGIYDARSTPTTPAPPPAPSVAPPAMIPAVDDAPRFSAGLGVRGGDVMDRAAKARIEAQHASLNASGIVVDASQQVAASGTRMMELGYRTQGDRAREHAAKMPARDAIDAIIAEVTAEKRRDVVVSAADIARNLQCNGKIKVFDRKLTVQAVRGIASRCESPMLGYVLGLYERIVETVGRARTLETTVEETNGRPSTLETLTERREEAKRLFEAAHDDRVKIGEVLVHELKRAGDTRITLRMRDGESGDIYAALGPSYGRADAPDVLPRVRDALPADARATWAYNPTSTTWELRTSVWTPTPVAEQAIGEAFEGWVSYRSRDNGTGRLHGGGGITLIRCYNASVYEAEGTSVARVHRGRILDDVGAMTSGAMHAIDALCRAWGTSRTVEVEAPSGVTIEQAIPGFWRALLSDPRQLAGVLPGRKADNVERLSDAFFSERRDADRIVRADFGQAWTRAIQSSPADVRRDAEAAIGGWLVGGRPMPRCDVTNA